MKKLLVLLLLPLFSYGQDISAYLKFYNYTTDEEITQETSIAEGDTLVTQLHLSVANTESFDWLGTAKYFTMDIEYNNQVLGIIQGTQDFKALDAIGQGGSVNGIYGFGGQTYTGGSDLLSEYILWQDGQKAYSSANDKSVERVTFQLSQRSIQEMLFGDLSTDDWYPVYEFHSIVKVGAMEVEDKSMQLNLGTIQDDKGDNVLSLTANPSNVYNYEVAEPTVYNVKLHFELPSSMDATNFKVGVQKTQSFSSTDTTEFVEPEFFTLDAAGDVIITDVDIDEAYYVYNLEPINSSYIPDVHTITDAYRSFKYLNDVGINGTETVYNNFGLFSADANLDQIFNSGDVYGLLAYVMGVDVASSSPEAPGYCLPEQMETGEWRHGCTAVTRYESYTIEDLGVAVDINREQSTEPEEEPTGGWSGEFIPTEEELDFNFAFWHHVDLDQSHSTSFPANVAAKAAKSGINLSNKAVGTVNLDMVSRVEDGKVYVELTHKLGDIVGLQARLKYDTSKLTLDKVIYDTGNTLTNFSKHNNGDLLIGTISPDGSEDIKRGKTFTVIFDGNVSNTTGLFHFNNTDAVKSNGDKMNLTIR